MRTFYVLLIAAGPVILYNLYCFNFTEHKGIDQTEAIISGVIGMISYTIADKLIKKS